MKRRIALLTAALVALSGLAGLGGRSDSWAAERSVSVSLPSFTVTLNGEKVNNDYSQYPLIVYNNITYFPMTYSDCRYLGIESTWKGNKDGLFIEATGVTAAYNPYRASARNGRSYRATVPGFPITVGGKAVDNGKEEYPLLSFRNITYFPMTWKWAVDAFGWEYNFDAAGGLVIRSDNTHLTQAKLTDNRPKESEYSNYKGKPSTCVTVTDKYIYYEGASGGIFQAPLSDPAKGKKVYQMELWDYFGDGSYTPHNLYSKDGKAYLEYHVGGATMGNEYILKLNDDGTTTVFNDNRTVKVTYGDKTFEWWVGPAPSAANLTMSAGGGEPVKIGDPRYLYGWNWSVSGDSQGGGGNSTAYLVGDELYIMAFDQESANESQETTGVYKVNIKTNKTTRVTGHARKFMIEGDSLYYMDYDTLYKVDLSTGEETELARTTSAPYGQLSDMAVLGGKLYYQLQMIKPSQSSEPYNPPRYVLGRLKAGSEAETLLYFPDNNNLVGEPGMELQGTTEKYLVCTFEENDSTQYRIAVFDKAGDMVFKTSDKAYLRNITIVGDTIYYYNITTGTVCYGSLK